MPTFPRRLHELPESRRLQHELDALDGDIDVNETHLAELKRRRDAVAAKLAGARRLVVVPRGVGNA